MADDSPAVARPTLKTIAALTGLAVATISRALKDAPDIGEETKRRVREVAREVGYRPNRAGVRLRTGKTNVIALVLSAEHDMMNHTARLIYSISAALRDTAYHLIVMPFFKTDDPMTPIRYIVESGSADGVIINQIRPDDPRVRYMHDHSFPFATHGRTDMGINHPYSDFDNEAFARMGAAALIRRGRKRLALIAPPRGQSYSEHMVEGFLAEAQQHGVAAEVIRDLTSDDTSGRIEAGMARLFAGPQRPDGLVSGSTTAAMSAVAGAESCGLVLGRDFDVVAKEAIAFLHRFRREMIVVHEDVSRSGDFLARAVMNAIEHRDTASFQNIEAPTLRHRPGLGED